MILNKKEFIKKVNTLLYSFVWEGNDKLELHFGILKSFQTSIEN